MPNMKSSISVVITCYSEGHLIKDAVSSVLQQKTQPLEIVLVNDGSTHEETNQVCHDLAQIPILKLVDRPQNDGTSVARNHGFEAAAGDIIVPLDADDCLPENALAYIQSAFEQSPEVDFIYGLYIREDKKNEPQVINPGNISLDYMLQSKPWSLSSRWGLIGTTPLRKSLWKAVDGYDPNFDNNDLHDVEFWIRVLAQGCQYKFITKPIYHWRKYLGSNSRKVTPLAWYRIAKRHYPIYCQFGLDQRANELLLLGSKWMNETDEIKYYFRSLLKLVKQHSFSFSSLLILLIPTKLLQILAERKRRHR